MNTGNGNMMEALHRMSACLDACDGIPTAQLKAYPGAVLRIMEERDALRAECAALHAKIDAGKAQKPVAWIRECSDGGIEGPIMDDDRRMDDTRRSCWTPLYRSQGVVAPAVPDGWKLVPVVLNWDQVNEGREMLIDGRIIQCDPAQLAATCYGAMLAAAPEVEKGGAA